MKERIEIVPFYAYHSNLSSYEKFSKFKDLPKDLKIIKKEKEKIYLIPMLIVDREFIESKYNLNKISIFDRLRSKEFKYIRYSTELSKYHSNIISDGKKTNFELFIDTMIKEKRKRFKRQVKLYGRIMEKYEKIFNIKNELQGQLIYQLINYKSIIIKIDDLKEGLEFIFNGVFNINFSIIVYH